MVNLVTINEHGQLKITPYESVSDAKKFIKKAVHGAPESFSATMPNYTIVKHKNCDVTYLILTGCHVELTVKVPDGRLIANTTDPLYPGIDIEYISDNENENTDCLTRPRVLFEKPYDNRTLSAMIWNGKNNEDYTHKTIFEECDKCSMTR